MKAPRRLAVENDTSELARSLLAAGQARREPHGARERVWKALAVGLAGSAAGGATATGAVTTGTSTGSAAAGTTGAGASVKGVGITLALTKAKLLATAAIVAAASVTVVAIERNEPPKTMDVATAAPAPAKPHGQREAIEPAPSPTEAPIPRSEERVDEPVVASATPVASVVPRLAAKAASVKDETAAPVSQLREEAALLHELRAALARGDLGAARAKLDEARTRFPKSQLAPERDALEVRLASDSGDHARAAMLAREFVERYPESPLRAGIESTTSASEKQ